MQVPTRADSLDPGTHTDVRALRRSVLRFGRRGLRPLPWRATRDPWSVLVSEVMLQQTQAPRVVAPYVRFLEVFPTPVACAAAGLGDVLIAWAGLGYNRRAKALHAAAGEITTRHDGAVPDDLDALVRLPGVGHYTARAVLAFAFERPEAVVDTNVDRVLARAVAGSPLTPAAAQRLADRLVPARQSWLWNQALMELGAVVCRARNPGCSRCPIRAHCAWAKAGAPEPDPARRGPPQSRFAGSDRQGRGRLLAALRHGPVRPAQVARACGWPDDPARAGRVAASLVSEGLARRVPPGVLRFP